MLRFVLISLLLAAVLLTGCLAPRASAPDPRLEHEDIPESLERAHALEAEANDMVEAANRRRHTGKRREMFNRAIGLLREARMLFENELLGDGGKATPERQRNLETEIARLSDRIEVLHRDRPAQ